MFVQLIFSLEIHFLFVRFDFIGVFAIIDALFISYIQDKQNRGLFHQTYSRHW